MMGFTPTLCTDYYKECHFDQYNPKMTKLVSYYTPRMSRVKDKSIVMFGLQYFIKSFLIENFKKNFFGIDKYKAVAKYYRLMKYTMGERFADTTRWEKLWDLGYLPLEINAVAEGTRIPMKCPMIEITNTHPDFVWLVNYIETAMSCNLWHTMASANVGYHYRQIVDKFYDETVDDNIPKSSAIGDFSMRGQESEESAAKSSAAFLLSFTKTATIPAIEFLEKYYNCNIENELVATGLASSEHSVMCSNALIDGNEEDTVKRFLTEIYPNDNFTMVSDSYDYWNMLSNIIAKPEIKAMIMNHNGFCGCRGDCYDNQTQILTNNGWKLFNDLETNDLVAQFDGKEIDFVKPLKIINKKYSGKMINFKSKKYGLDLCVTPNHRMIYADNKGNIGVEIAETMKFREINNLIVSAPKKGSIDHLTDYERLMIAFQADGRCRGINKTEQFSSGYTLEFNFSKERKIKRMEDLLNRLGYEYSKRQTECNLVSKRNKNWKDEYIIYVNIPNKPFKSLSEWVDFTDKSSIWCKELVEEASHWDGHIRKNLIGYSEFDNTDKNSIDIIYTASILSGYKTKFSKKEDNRKSHYNTCYRCFSNSKKNYINGDSVVKEEYEYNGTIHCVTVPSGMILVRRNEQCAICGNSGNPVDIICGISVYNYDSIEEMIDCERGDANEKAFACSGIETYNMLKESRNICKVDNKYYEVVCKYGIEKEHTACSDTDIYFVRVSDIKYNEIECRPEFLGTVEVLWNIFGGTVNSKGFKVLDSHIKAVYGDSITPERATEIYKRLKGKGFASNNVMLGMGSYSLQSAEGNTPLTRDTYSVAVKSTYCEVEDKKIMIFKDPKTDNGNFKKSQKGCCVVLQDDVTKEIKYCDGMMWNEKLAFRNQDLLKPVFRDGVLISKDSLKDIRNRLHGGKF